MVYYKACVTFYDQEITVKQVESMSHTFFEYSLCVHFEKPKRFARSVCVSVDQCVVYS